ncbi:MAG: hypothetical protein ACQCN3_00260 [Candidatus Bathyarchaeia archaeon]
MSKSSVFLLVFILATSVLITGGLVSAADKLSVPEFTLEYVVTPVNSPPTTWINPYTGKNESLFPSYNGETQSVEIKVKNQPFNPYIDTDGNIVNVYYNVSLKGHYSNIWSQYPDSTSENLFNASNTDITVITIPLGNYPNIPNGGKLDFRLEAIIGHYNYNQAPSGTEYVTGFSVFESSDWSKTQTVTIGDGTPLATPDPSQPLQSLSPPQKPSPDASLSQSNAKTAGWLGLDWIWIAVFGVVAVLAAFTALVLLNKRR